MPFRLKKSNCIAVGSFNIYIFPEWVRRMAPFPDGVEMHVHNDLSRAGLRLFSPNLTLSWTIRPDKIILESDSPNDNCGEIMERMFETLPWTPLLALGNNFYFEAPPEEIENIRRPLDFPAAASLDDYQFSYRGWYLGLEKDGTKCGMQLTVKPDSLLLAANFHRELEDQPNERAREAARSFENDRRESIRLFEELLGVSIEHGNVHV